MKGMTRMIATLLAFALLTAACGGSDGTGDTTATTAAPTTSIAASSQDTSPSTSAVTATTAPPDTTEPVATTPPAGAASIDCGIWEFVQQFETPAEMGDAIFQGDIDAEAIAPSTIAECLGFNSWRSELVIDGIDGDGTDFTKLTVLSELTISGDTVTSRERFIPDDSTTRIFEARAFGDQIWLSGPDGDWFLMPAEGEGGGFGDMAEHAETFGFFFSAGLLTAFAVVGSLVYGPLAEPGERVDVGGVDATIWSVTPEAASAFAQSLGANLPPAAFADTEATYWVTDNGQIVRIEISIPPGSPIPEAQEGSLTYRLYDFGAPISVDPIDG